MVRMTWWGRVREALAFVLALEPVLVQNMVRALFVLGATVGLVATDELQGRALAAVAAFYVLAEAAGAVWARGRAVPSVKVVETVEMDGTRRAGEASPLPTGEVVGSADDLHHPI